MPTGVVPIQPACWSSWTDSPTITSSTTPSRTPVATSIRLYGNRRWRPNVTQPMTATNGQAESDALQHRPRAVAQAQVLQEQDDLEALAVDRGEAKQGQPQHRPLRR